MTPPPELHSDDPQIAAAISAAREAKAPICARFEEHGSDLVAYLNAGPTTERRADRTREVKLTPGRGVPLAELPRTLEVNRPQPGTRKLLARVEERGGHQVEILELTSPRGQPIALRKHLWSPDGKILYILTDFNGLMRIDADDGWQVTAEFYPRMRELGFVDIAWSSAGLVCLEATGLDDGSQQTPWICLEPSEPPKRSHPAFRMLVLDPVSLTTIHSWYVRGDHLAGHPKSGQVFVARSGAPVTMERGKLVVVEVLRGELMNVIDGESLRPKNDVVRKSDVIARAVDHPGVTVDRPVISPDGKWLLNLPDPAGDHAELTVAADISRFRIDGPRVTCEERIQNLDKDERAPFKITDDSQYLCTSDHRKPGYFLLDLANLSRYAGSAETYSTGGAFALDGETKTIYLERTIERVAENKWEFGIYIVHDGKTETIPWPGDVSDLDIRPQHRGVFVVTRLTGSDCYWISHESAGHARPIVEKAATSTPQEDSKRELKSEVPAQPLEPDPTRREGVSIPIRAVWASWTPDGKAFIVIDLEGIIHRFDGATHRETRRLSFGKFRQTIATAAGLVIGRERDQSFTLIDYESLSPIRQLLPLMRTAGNLLHSRIVGASEAGLRVVDVSTGKVVAESSLDRLAYEKLPGDPRFGSLAILNDGNCILYNDCGQTRGHETKIAILHVKGSSLDVEIPPSTSFRRPRHTGELYLRISSALDVVAPADRHALDQYVRNLTPVSSRPRASLIVFSQTGKQFRRENGRESVWDEKGNPIVGVRFGGPRVVPNPIDETRLLYYSDGPFTGLPSYLVEQKIKFPPAGEGKP
jgi:hypothetical protein